MLIASSIHPASRYLSNQQKRTVPSALLLLYSIVLFAGCVYLVVGDGVWSLSLDYADDSSFKVS